MEPWADSSLYHSLGAIACSRTYREAMFTFEQEHIEKASMMLKQCISLCSKHRKHTTITQNIGKMVKRRLTRTLTRSYAPEVLLHHQIAVSDARAEFQSVRPRVSPK
ncbi:tetratricopeptide repeat protein 39B-like [Temnothorax americanus]|uniref:tetratricopeptide repeat protein 39B-like n=1 Tax=Temnothorax americanus TaxID=1964332 RepID=UPI004067B9E2